MASVARAYIGLGSNLQDPVSQLRRAIDAMALLPDTRLFNISSFYESKPLVDPGATAVDTEPQGLYINAVAAVDTYLAARTLLDALFSIEAQQGRVRTRRWGPRTLDLDLLLYGNLCINEPDLIVPHPELPKRAFVLYPLYEIEPVLQVPGIGPVEELLKNCDANELKKLDVVP